RRPPLGGASRARPGRRPERPHRRGAPPEHAERPVSGCERRELARPPRPRRHRRLARLRLRGGIGRAIARPPRHGPGPRRRALRHPAEPRLVDDRGRRRPRARRPAAPRRAGTRGARGMSRDRIVVAMSGGVDSAVAAARVVAAGHEVIGISLRLARDGSGSCCSLDDFHDARAVADRLGFPHYVFDMTDAFERHVVRPFVAEYLAGRTPNPCARCNEHVKFGLLWRRARELGATRLETGHYARIATDPETGRLCLRTAVDAAKDQTYFLFALGHEELARTLFPVGELTKTEVRAEAARLGLPVAAKPESMEVCFVPDGDAAGFVARRSAPTLLRPGRVVDDAGHELGRHGGIHRFTVGQRRGLGLAGGPRRYVSAIDATTG